MGLRTRYHIRVSVANAGARAGCSVEPCERYLTYSALPQIRSEVKDTLPQSYLPWMCAALVLFVEVWMKGVLMGLIVMLSGTALLLLILLGLSMCSSIGDEEPVADTHYPKGIHESSWKRRSVVRLVPLPISG